MESLDVKAECEQEIAAIERNKEFWERHIARLKQQGVQPSQASVDWVQKHLAGLDATCQRLQEYIVKIEQSKNATRS